MTDQSSLAPLAERLSSARLLCVGDAMLDRYVSGDVSRISPEAPIPVLRSRKETVVLGGAGNVIRNLVTLGAEVVFVSVVGDDGGGRQLAELVGALPGVRSGLVVVPGRKTSLKTRFLGETQQLLRVDDESDGPLDRSAEDDLVRAAREMVGQVDAVVLSDYAKGVLGPRTLHRVIEISNDAGRRVFVDPKGTDYARYGGAFLLTPNLKELSEATRMPVDGDSAVVAAATHLNRLCGTHAILATRGKDGMSLVRGDGRVTHLPARAREVYDVSGAGDTVIATLAAAHAVGADLDDAARLSNAAAEVVVGRVGTAAVSTRELIEALHAEDLHRAEDKILPLASAIERVETWRRQNQRVGFTNGCFDLLHPGHLSLFRQASERCDRLVVGLNSDASIRRLKGEGRPIQNQAARSAVLASLSVVDMVVIFQEDTPESLLTALRPDVLVKGADYQTHEVVGADFVTGYGGEVFLARLEAGHSTTHTIERIARNEESI